MSGRSVRPSYSKDGRRQLCSCYFCLKSVLALVSDKLSIRGSDRSKERVEAVTKDNVRSGGRPTPIHASTRQGQPSDLDKWPANRDVGVHCQDDPGGLDTAIAFKVEYLT